MAVNNSNLPRTFQAKYSGPYRIIEILGPVTYRIYEIYGSHQQIVHADRLKPFAGEIIPSGIRDKTPRLLNIS